MELSIGCVRRLTDAFANRTRKVGFFLIDFAQILLGHALGLDHHALGLNHHAPLVIFRPNFLKQAKTEGFFQQRELGKTYTAGEVFRMAAQIDVSKRHPHHHLRTCNM